MFYRYPCNDQTDDNDDPAETVIICHGRRIDHIAFRKDAGKNICYAKAYSKKAQCVQNHAQG